MSAPKLSVPAPAPLLPELAPLSVPGNAVLSVVSDNLGELVERASNPAAVAELSEYLRSPGVLSAILEGHHAPLIGALCAATDFLEAADARSVAAQVCWSAEARATLMASPEWWTHGAALHMTRLLPPDASTESWVRALTSPEQRAAMADHGSGLGIGRALHAVAQHLPSDGRSEVAVRRLLTAEACEQLRPPDKVKAAHAVMRHCPPGEGTQALLRNVLASRGNVELFTATMTIASRSADPAREQIMDGLFTAEAIETLGERAPFIALHQAFETLPLLSEGRRAPVAQALLMDARIRDVMLHGEMFGPGNGRRLNLGGLASLLEACELLPEAGKSAVVPAVLTADVLVSMQQGSLIRTGPLSQMRTRELIDAVLHHLPAQEQVAWRAMLQAPVVPEWRQMLDRAPSPAGGGSGRAQGGPSAG